MCRILYSFVGYLCISGSGSITSVWEERAYLLVFTCNYVVSVGEVSSSSVCLGWAALFYCCTPLAFHIIILYNSFESSVSGHKFNKIQILV